MTMDFICVLSVAVLALGCTSSPVDSGVMDAAVVDSTVDTHDAALEADAEVLCDPEECDDGNPCNGVERCQRARCFAGDPADDFTVCELDDTGTPGLCEAGTCVASRCGDGFVDEATGEECDDSRDTRCTADCRVLQTSAFRISGGVLLDPHIHDVACNDLTARTLQPTIDWQLNHSQMNHVIVFEDLDPEASSWNATLYVGAECGEFSGECEPGTAVATPMTLMAASGTEACWEPDATRLSDQYLDPPTVGAPCFSGAISSFVSIEIGPRLDMRHLELSATFDLGASPRQLVGGVLAGYADWDALETTALPWRTPGIGAALLRPMLAAGAGSFCRHFDARDEGPPGTPPEKDGGFWFFYRFDAVEVVWP